MTPHENKLSSVKPLEKIVVKAKKKKSMIKTFLDDKRFYLSLVEKWSSEGRRQECEECDEPVYEISTLNFHHVLPKKPSAYPQFRYEPKNIVFLCWQCHDRVERGLISEWMENKILEVKQKLNIAA